MNAVILEEGVGPEDVEDPDDCRRMGRCGTGGGGLRTTFLTSGAGDLF